MLNRAAADFKLSIVRSYCEFSVCIWKTLKPRRSHKAWSSGLVFILQRYSLWINLVLKVWKLEICERYGKFHLFSKFTCAPVSATTWILLLNMMKLRRAYLYPVPSMSALQHTWDRTVQIYVSTMPCLSFIHLVQRVNRVIRPNRHETGYSVYSYQHIFLVYWYY